MDLNVLHRADARKVYGEQVWLRANQPIRVLLTLIGGWTGFFKIQRVKSGL